jgi:hypothetical protein
MAQLSYAPEPNISTAVDRQRRLPFLAPYLPSVRFEQSNLCESGDNLVGEALSKAIPGYEPTT